jgi:ectoine hydroxylase-related dioxygenase (phytanoyl-CoA dioxygenase family)
MAAPSEERPIVRDLTEDEVRAFHENGWVFVKNYVDRDIVARMLAWAKERMGVDDRGQLDASKVTSVKNWWWELSDVAREEDVFAAVGHSPAMGRNIQRLFRRDVPILYIADSLMTKAPASGSNGCGPTSWHQDIPSFPFDRSGTTTCWLALDHLTPDMGTMHFLEGSHRGEIFGRIPASEDPYVVLKNHPHLLEDYAEVASPTFEPGDATFHHCQIVHGAPANTSDRMRWSYTLGCLAADSLYTGASCVYTDGLGLPVEQPLRHPRFPQIWPADA